MSSTNIICKCLKIEQYVEYNLKYSYRQQHKLNNDARNSFWWNWFAFGSIKNEDDFSKTNVQVQNC